MIDTVGEQQTILWSDGYNYLHGGYCSINPRQAQYLYPYPHEVETQQTIISIRLIRSICQSKTLCMISPISTNDLWLYIYNLCPEVNCLFEVLMKFGWNCLIFCNLLLLTNMTICGQIAQYCYFYIILQCKTCMTMRGVICPRILVTNKNK